MTSTLEVIKEIRNHLKEKRLSVIIGAGFSKNASNLFLSWKELLHDMIVEMYGKKTKLGKSQIDQLVESVISEKGYLSLASEYVRRHGYHEAIDQYIESRTPVVKKDENDYSLSSGGEGENNPVDLSIHRLLLSLGWNNLYTFNYDNLLDVAADTNKYDEIGKNITKCLDEILQLSKEKVLIEGEIAKLDDKTSDGQDLSTILIAKEGDNKNLRGTSYATESSAENERILSEGHKRSEDRKQELQEEVKRCETKIKANENRIENLRREQKDLYLLVDSAFKISLRKTKNIYKLHGNIRSNRSDRYGFDQDSKCHYIISQEDYDNYREKHEAFVALMRIALLQDYFCLIGFSGDDPNFLSWISWVKDIIDQRALYEKSLNGNDNNTKIFFIDVSGLPLDRGKELFFKNHYIKHVPLLDKPGNGSNIKNKVNEFLKSLKSEKEKAIEAIEEYKSFWETNTFSEKKNTDDYVAGFKRSEIRSVWENLQYNRLPKFKHYACQKRRYVIGSIETYIQKQTVDEDMAKLFLLAVKGELLPISTVIDDKDIDKFEEQIKNYDEILLALKSSRMRHATLAGKKELDDLTDMTLDESIYESIVRMFFNMDFASAKKMIEEWDTRDIRWRVIKLVLKELLGIANGNDVPLSIDFDFSDYNNQELLYSLQTLRRMMFWVNNKERIGEIEQIIDEIKESPLKESVFNNLDDNIEYLIRKVGEQKVTIFPYGNNRTSFNLGASDLPLIYSMQLLQYFIETGLPLAAVSVIYFKKESWYSAFKNIYEIFPYPCLFYSLQYGNNRNYIQKIAQDYVYSNKLRDFCEKALVKMLQSYRMTETPLNIKNAILLASPLFFTYVSSNVWQSDFETIYNESDLSDRNENRAVGNPLYDFLIAGIEYSRRKPFNRKVLYETLKLGEEIDDIDNRMIIAAKGIVTIKKQSQGVKESIDNLISKSKSVNNFYVLFNLQTILTQEQKSLFLEKLLKYDYSSCPDPSLIMASLEFGKDTPLAKKIESEIIRNPMLWKNGIGKDKTGKYSTISQSHHLPLHTIQKFISFSPQTIEKLYEKMKSSLDVIIQYHAKNKEESFLEFINPGGVLLEMLIFLGNNKGILSKLSDFTNILSKVELMHTKLSRFASIIDALTSIDSKVVNKGIVQLSYEVQYLGFKHFTTEYLVIANIILKRFNPGLSNSIVHFSDVIENYFTEVDKVLFEPIIRKILDVYQPYFSDIKAVWDLDVKKELVENAMIVLNKTMKKWGEGCSFWDKHQRLFNI